MLQSVENIIYSIFLPGFLLLTSTIPYYSLSWSLYPSPLCAHLIPDKCWVWGNLLRQYQCHQLQNFGPKISIYNSWTFHTNILTKGQIALAGRISLWALGAQTQAVKIKRNNLASVAYIRKCSEQHSLAGTSKPATQWRTFVRWNSWNVCWLLGMSLVNMKQLLHVPVLLPRINTAFTIAAKDSPELS